MMALCCIGTMVRVAGAPYTGVDGRHGCRCFRICRDAMHRVSTNSELGTDHKLGIDDKIENDDKKMTKTTITDNQYKRPLQTAVAIHHYLGIYNIVRPQANRTM